MNVMNLQVLSHKLFIALLFLLFFSTKLVTQENKRKLVEIKKELDSAYYTFDVNFLKRIIRDSEQLRTKSNWYPDYYIAIAYFQLGKIVYNYNSDLSYYYFDKSLDYLLEVKKRFYDEEIAALISAVYGKKSSLSPLKAIYFGIKAKDYIYEAASIDSNNSKVLLIGAIHLMHTPEAFGGDKKWAESLLKRALKNLYKFCEEDTLRIEWGKDAEIYAYLSQLEILRKRKYLAKLFMEKALALKPSYGFVLKDLILQYNKID